MFDRANVASAGGDCAEASAMNGLESSRRSSLVSSPLRSGTALSVGGQAHPSTLCDWALVEPECVA